DCLAGVYSHLRRPVEAREASDEAVHLTPVAARVPNSLLVAVARRDLKAVDSLLQHKPETDGRGRRNTERAALFAAGQRALLAGRSEDALAAFKEALRRPPPYHNLDWQEDCLADAYFQLGRLDEAIGEYQRALSVYPGGLALARYHLATAY